MSEERAPEPEEDAARDPDGGVSPARHSGEEDARDPDEADVNPTGDRNPDDNPPLPREWN